jgi:hypothetical protein
VKRLFARRALLLLLASLASWAELGSLEGLSSLSGSSALGCVARPATRARGIELEDPNERSQSEADAGAASTPQGVPSEGAPSAGADPLVAAADPDESQFVYSREPLAERARAVAQFPIHIHEAWWPFRARHLRISEAEAQKRDARISDARAPAGFWDAQTAVEAVSVWTVLCNECHGGRRNLDDAVEMPTPPPTWGEDSGLFFGNRRTYRQLFNTVHDGGPLKANGRVGMPAWRNILSKEMMWALLYFLEYQSGGVESRFPPSLYPRRPKLMGEASP